MTANRIVTHPMIVPPGVGPIASTTAENIAAITNNAENTIAMTCRSYIIIAFVFLSRVIPPVDFSFFGYYFSHSPSVSF